MVKRGNVVKEYMLGNTKIKICDDAYRDKTQKDIDDTLKRIEAIIIDAYRRGAVKTQQ